MCGAIRPVAEVGLRPIWSHVCARGWARAQAEAERMMAILSSTREVFSSNPIGSVTAPFMKLSGSKLLGVTPCTFLKSNISTWLGAPRRNRKITLLAVFCGCTDPTVSVAPGASRSARKKPPTPGQRVAEEVPSRAVRALEKAVVRRLPPRHDLVKSFSLVHGNPRLVVEIEVRLVEQRPHQVGGAVPPVAAL